MKPEEIKLNDWARIFAGNVPPEFYLELIIRAAFVYLLLMVSMRLMGKRMSAQMSRIELATLVSLAAAIGVPMLSPDRGLLPALIIAAVVVGMSRVIAMISLKSQNFEQLTQGNLVPLVIDSVCDMKATQRSQITRERLFAQLRLLNTVHLGEVKRVYLEANGSFSVLKNEKQEPGLSVLPITDREYEEERVVTTDEQVCQRCGHKKDNHQHQVHCGNCGHARFTRAVIDKTFVKHENELRRLKAL